MKKMSPLSLTSAFVLGLALAVPAGAFAQDTPEPAETLVPLTGIEAPDAQGMIRFAPAEEDATEILVELRGVENSALTAYVVEGTCTAPGVVRLELGEVVIHQGEGNGAFRAERTYPEVVAGPAAVRLIVAGEEEAVPVLCGEFASEPAHEGHYVEDVETEG